MRCVGIEESDRQGRILISNLFDNTPNSVQIVIDIDREMIEIIPKDTAGEYGKLSQVDEKGRIIIPKWIRDELDGKNKFLLIIDDNRLFLSPKTGKIF